MTIGFTFHKVITSTFRLLFITGWHSCSLH